VNSAFFFRLAITGWITILALTLFINSLSPSCSKSASLSSAAALHNKFSDSSDVSVVGSKPTLATESAGLLEDKAGEGVVLILQSTMVNNYVTIATMVCIKI